MLLEQSLQVGGTLSLPATIYALGTVAAAGTAVLLWGYRDRSGATALLAMMCSMVVWNGSLLVLEFGPGSAVTAVLIRTVFVGVAVVSLAKLVFVLEYTGREHLLRPAVLGPLAVPPVLTVALAVFNPRNSFFADVDPTATGSAAIIGEFGPAALLPFVYGHGINVVLTLLVLGFIYRSRSIYRGQSIALFGGTVAPWIANLVFTMDLVSFDVTAVGSVASGALFTIAIVRYRLLDLMPIARDRVLDTVHDGVFVVDAEDRLVDVNPAGRRMLSTVGVDTDDLVGRRFPSLFDATDLRERYEDATETHDRTTESVSIGDAHFRTTVTPIDDGRGRHVGWLLLAHDVTERKRYETELERQNERLERFASLVSHDLRNPLNVADGYLELAREADDDEEYLAEVAESHDRMETIIEDVLALAREGAADADLEPVDLESIAGAAWASVDTGAADVRIDGTATIRADPDRFRRALENLVRNAIDHAADREDAAGLEITVGTIPAGTDAIDGFYVADDGIGIPACRRDQVFDDGYTTDESGTGLGLSIVERIADAHGWTVAVAESESGGARFEFRNVEAVPDADGEVASSAADRSGSATDVPSS